MLEQFSRTELLIGEKALEKLNNSKVAVFGLGGVGSYVIEGLVRAGVGKFVLVDNDEISLTNLNRQIIATQKTLGKAKVEVQKERILEINPNARVEIYKEFFLPETIGIIDNTINYIIDCVDTVTAKVELAVRANQFNIPIISSMGTGNKLDPTQFEITDIYKTSVCPLAKVMRKELRARNIPKLKVIYSKEQPLKVKINEVAENTKSEYLYDDLVINKASNKVMVPGSVSFVPSVAGLIIAGEVVKDLIKFI